MFSGLHEDKNGQQYIQYVMSLLRLHARLCETSVNNKNRKQEGHYWLLISFLPVIHSVCEQKHKMN